VAAGFVQKTESGPPLTAFEWRHAASSGIPLLYSSGTHGGNQSPSHIVRSRGNELTGGLALCVRSGALGRCSSRTTGGLVLESQALITKPDVGTPDEVGALPDCAHHLFVTFFCVARGLVVCSVGRSYLHPVGPEGMRAAPRCWEAGGRYRHVSRTVSIANLATRNSPQMGGHSIHFNCNVDWPGNQLRSPYSTGK